MTPFRPLLAVALLMLSAGCVSQAPAALAPHAAASTATPGAAVDAPDLPVGRAFTYDIPNQRGLPSTVTVVVASKNASGYLFATSDDAWVGPGAVMGFEFLGPHTLDLRQTQRGDRPIAFPLSDGATWEYYVEKAGVPLTARASRVATPDGDRDGFVIEGKNDEHTWHFEYAPSVGYFTRILVTEHGAPEWDLTLRSVTEGAHWAWGIVDAGPAFAGGATPGTDKLDVPGSAKHVFVAAMARGGRVTLTPPPTSGAAPWSYDGSQMTMQTLDAKPGTWVLAVSATPQTIAYGEAVALHVLRG